MTDHTSLERMGEILGRARRSSVDYYRLTGKALGITGEVGEDMIIDFNDHP